MSLFHPTNLVCPSCEAPIEMMAVSSVNADRRPDFRDDILENRFQDVTCAACNTQFRLQPEFNYLDAGRGQWIVALPSSRLRDHLGVEDEADALFDASYGEKAPAAARDVGENLNRRVTFGWPAVREKLLLRAHDLDDAVIEMVKMDVLRRIPEAPVREGVELRVVAVHETAFDMLWLETATEAPVTQMSVPRSIYTAIVAVPDDWAKLRARIDNGPFVDMQKTFIGPGRVKAAE
ncbi:CpXC domain-containing protein [Pseudopelagicola sp. nBUS_19]|uniref:CpXC domain-containing protein n=1 Tax=Pseudopelagicola sp. nBUS_19 TaxID=3395316 RepID=UPI003EB8B0F4